MDTAINSNLLYGILPQIRQYEATTGRTITPQAIEALVRSQVGAVQERALQNEQIGLEKERIGNEKRSARASGITQIGGTAVQSGILYKSLVPDAPKPVPSLALSTSSPTLNTSAPALQTSFTPTSINGAITEESVGTPSIAESFTNVGTGSAATPASFTMSGAALPALGAAGVGYGTGSLFANTAFKGKSKGVRARAGFASGAAAGAVYGSFIPIPGVGTAVGAVVGGLIGGVSGAIGGQK